ncbi:MAG: hypothetical protein LBB59_06320 [Campylobacteraceae bacterium]|jgi:hypothetical protein|nr:hypothetical protein [Campylobacteraceae bacterium]
MKQSEFEKELDEFFAIRDELFAFLDKSIPKDKSGFNFDFSKNPQLDAQSFYKIFYRYDYKARKTFAGARKLLNVQN